ncbi:hypothetical protein [Bradyrhizobium sp.]|uniref:hypothetical protein n=1 Tax=Bradyrhizobium sp. TaxID=376 RepID=UPI0039E3D61E
MRKFETEIIREYDAEGRLSAAGLRWVEARYGVLAVGGAIFWLAVYVAAVLAITAICMGGAVGLVKPTASAGLTALAAVMMLRRWGLRERAAIFHFDHIAVPFGQPRARKSRRLEVAIGEAANVEVWRSGYEFWLLVYTRSADAYVLGRGLNEFQARKVVTLLSHARDDLRGSLTRHQSNQPSARRIIE